MMEIDEAKTAFNARAKASMREFLRSKTWEEKVESIARMNKAAKIAQEGMRKALAAERERKEAAPKTSTTEEEILAGWALFLYVIVDAPTG